MVSMLIPQVAWGTDRRPVIGHWWRGWLRRWGYVEVLRVGDGELGGDIIGEPRFGWDRAELEFAGHDGQDVGGDAGVEGELAGGGRHDLAGEELPDGLEQLARGGPSMRGRGWLRGGRDARTAGCGPRRGLRLEQQQQVPFLLADPAPDRGQSDRPVRAGQVRLGLLHADGSPAQRAEYLPPAQLAKGDVGSARGAVGSQQFFPAAQASGWRGGAEAPRFDAEPAEVLGRVAGMDKFPVDDGAQR